MLGELREHRVVLDRVVHLDDLAVLAAEVAEPPVVGDHRKVRRLGFDLLERDLALGRPLDQPPERLHVVAQVIVDLAQVLARRLLRGRQAFERLDRRAGGIVEELDVEEHRSGR